MMPNLLLSNNTWVVKKVKSPTLYLLKGKLNWNKGLCQVYSQLRNKFKVLKSVSGLARKRKFPETTKVPYFVPQHKGCLIKKSRIRFDLFILGFKLMF